MITVDNVIAYCYIRLGQGGPPLVLDPNNFVEDEWNRYNEMYFAFIDIDLDKSE